MLLWMATRGWVLFLPLIASVALAVALADVRWAIVALAYILVCVPMILTPIAFSYILKPAARRQLSMKTVDIAPDSSLTITYFDIDPDSGEPVGTGAEIIPSSEVRSIFHIFHKTIILLKSEDFQIIIIPD